MQATKQTGSHPVETRRLNTDTNNPHVREISEAIEQKRLVPIVGAGVSAWTARLPGWLALVEQGLDYVAGLGTHSPEELEDARLLLSSGDTIAAAQRLKALLRAPGGEYRRWLRKTFRISPDQAISDQLIGSIRRLSCPVIATTNYDKLISIPYYPMMEPVTWRNTPLMHDALTEGSAVLHLHGVYDDPESVVLGEDDYETVVQRAPAYRDILKTLWLDRTLLFIGCSFAGIEDPDFINLLKWAADTFPDSAHKHYALFRSGSFKPDDVGRFLHDWRIQIVSYGETFDDLAPFIERLNPKREQVQLQGEGRPSAPQIGIAGPVISGTEVLQLVKERDAFHVRASTAHERYLHYELERLRGLLNGGYTKPAQEGLTALITEVEDPECPLTGSEMKGRIYLLAANAFVPMLPGGDLDRARAYLSEARAYLSSEKGVAGCQVIEARLLSYSSGKDAALSLLLGQRHPDADRVTFTIHLDAGEVSHCATIIDNLSSSGVLATDDWYRPLALYYAEIGNAARLDAIVEKMTANGEAMDYSTAAYALFHLAYRGYRSVCEANHICPEAHFAGDLGLNEFIDGAAELRAIRFFEKAADAYESHDCPAEAAREIVNAIRISVDSQAAESPKELVDRLERLEPEYPFLASIKGEKAAGASNQMAQLRGLVESSEADPNALLDLSNALSTNVEHKDSVLHLLGSNPKHFLKSDDTYVRYLHVLFDFYRATRSPAETEAWLSSLEPPAQYSHMKAIFHVAFYSEQSPSKASEWVGSALRDYPERPEVLKLALFHYRIANDSEKALVYARKLFEVLRTGSTARLLLESLFAAHQYPQIIQLVEENSDLQIDEQVRHRCLGRAYVAGSHFPQAREHLEWLRKSGVATLTDLLNLSTTYVYIGDLDQALSVLNDTLERYPDEPRVYLLLSDVYLQRGEDADSYAVALEAYRRFPDGTEVTLHLVRTGFTTGHHTDGAVSEAFRQFMPGGRFADTGHFEMVPLQEGVEMILARQEWVQSLYSLYNEGRSSLMMLCHLQDGPLFRAHVEGEQFRLLRYAGIGAYLYDIAKLIKPSKQVVLDYSALLTLWSLYGDRWPEVLRENYEKVWISAKLPGTMTWEHDRLRNRGQADRHRADITVRDAANRLYTKLQRLPRTDPEGDQDVLGEHTETMAAQDLGIPYLQEHLTDDKYPAVTVIGVRALAEVLTREGKLSPQLKAQLVAHAREMPSEEQHIVDSLASGSNIVAGITTLTTIALNGGVQALQACLEYFGTIYYSEPAWQRLQGDIDEFERLRAMAEDLRRLRGQVGDTISSGLLNPYTAPDGMQAIPTQGPPAEEEDKGNLLATINSNIQYINDLFAAARFHNAPVWADDRWIIKISNDLPVDARPPDVFGTDSFLIWKHASAANPTEYFDNYGKLVHWRYLGVPLNADYLFWLLEQGYAPDRGLVADACALYVQNVLLYMATDSFMGHVSPQFKQALLDTYGQSLVVLLYRCYRASIPPDRVSAVFKILDPTRYNVSWDNKEYHYYGCLLAEALAGRGLELIIDAFSTTGSAGLRDAVAVEGLSFLSWLETVLVGSGVGQAVLTAAKLDLLI